jgi:hypothetical protein
MGTEGEEAAKAAATATFNAQENAMALWGEMRERIVQHNAPATPQINGLAIDAGKTELTHTGASLKIAPEGVTINFGVSSFEVGAQGVSGSGPLIKLG